MTRKRLLFRILCTVLCILMLQCTPAFAADYSDEVFRRTISPELPVPGEPVNITVMLPTDFFGGVIEELPDGFIFTGTSHPEDGVKQVDHMIIFAITGEEEIMYTIQMPASGCGIITGEWEDIRTGISGDIHETVLAPAGTDPASCRECVHQSPGFDITVIICACIAAALAISLRRRER
jgi:hypothetical protein